MRRATMRTFVYVDGFNLYYGALEGTPWKWLDLPALFAKVLQPHHDIPTVKYFTARVSGTPADPSKPQRQDVYLRALRRYRPEVDVYFGYFLSHRVRAPLAEPAGQSRRRRPQSAMAPARRRRPNAWKHASSAIASTAKSPLSRYRPASSGTL